MKYMQRLIEEYGLFVRGLFTIAAGIACTMTAACYASERPNIILIMADDMGFSDLGCYGSEIETPQLDRLANGGLRFTQFYNTARCCPSRASLLTGLYPHSAGMGSMNYRKGKTDAYRGQIHDNAVTIAEHLQGAGYKTAMVGKWHLTWTNTINAGPNGSWPTQRGFDRFYGTMEGAKDYFKPTWMFEDTKQIKSFPEDFYYTRAISERAAQWIVDHDDDAPMLMYVAFYAPHFPLHAPKETVEKYRDRYQEGCDKIRADRHRAQIKSGLISRRTKMSPRDPDNPAWSDLSKEQREDLAYRMAIYAAQVDEMDQGVGRIVDALEAAGKKDNAVIVFLSDNGGTDSGGTFGKGKTSQLNQSGPYTTYGTGWANVSNTPYRLYKSNAHEGGVHTPLIIHGVDQMKSTGGFCRETAHIIDLTPTLIDIAGADPIGSRAGKRAIEIEGRSILPLIEGKKLSQRPIYFEHQGNRGIRYGKWKLVARGKKGKWELYNLDADPTELNDVADTDRDRVEQLSLAWQRWAKERGVKH